MSFKVVPLHWILWRLKEISISRHFAKNKKTTVLLTRRGFQICKNLPAILSTSRKNVDYKFHKIDDRRSIWSSSSSWTYQLIIGSVGTKKSKSRGESRNAFIDNWLWDQAVLPELGPRYTSEKFETKFLYRGMWGRVWFDVPEVDSSKVKLVFQS